MKQIFEKSAITDVTATDVNGVGSLMYLDEKIYRWVKNEETAVDFAVGDLVSHVIANGTTFTNTVAKVVTAGIPYIAGVACGAILAGYYGWVQIYGPGSVNVSGGTTGGTDILKGDWLKGSNAALYAVRDAAGTTIPTNRRSIQILSSVTTTTTPAAAVKAAMIYCLG